MGTGSQSAQLKKKEPLIIEMVEAILVDTDQSGSLSDMRLVTTCLLSYARFLQFSEVVEQLNLANQ